MVLTITRSPERRSTFLTTSRERAWLVIASSVCAMPVKFGSLLWMLRRLGRAVNAQQRCDRHLSDGSFGAFVPVTPLVQ